MTGKDPKVLGSTPKNAQNITIAKTNMKQQHRGTFVARQNNNFQCRGFGSSRLSQYSPNGKK